MIKYMPCIAALLLGGIPAGAQLYSDAVVTNDAGSISDWSTTWLNEGDYNGSNAGVFEHYGPSTLTFVNNGSYNATTGHNDDFKGPGGGAGAQEIAGTLRPYFYNVTFSNGGDVVITNTDGANVRNNAAFSNSLITTTNRAIHQAGALRFEDGAQYSGGTTDAQHVNGYVSKIGNDIFTFPVGNGTVLRTLSLTTAPAAITDEVSVAWFAGNPGTVTDPSDNATHSPFALGPGVQSVSTAGYWDWVPVSGAFAGTGIDVSIPDQSATGVMPADLRLIGWDGTQWVLLGTAGATGTAAGSVLSGNMLPGITAVGIGSITGVLPVAFAHFDVKKDNCTAILNWSTAMEYHNDYFTVERSADGLAFGAIGKVAAGPDGNHTQAYSYTDRQPLPGTNYYRIVQTDIDGKQSRTATQFISLDCDKEEKIQVYPTTTNGTLYVRLPAGYEHAEIKMYSILGQELNLPSIDREYRSGLHTIRFEGLAYAQYLLRIMQGKEVKTFKVIYRQ